jgi:hypothetical protein
MLITRFLTDPGGSLANNLNTLQECEREFSVAAKIVLGFTVRELDRVASRGEHITQPQIIVTPRHIHL